jgi:plasmid stabilization system protein ParE
VRRIRDTARSLDSLPQRGRVVPELAHPNVRELIVGNYRLVYEVTHEIVFILGVIHGARDLVALWARENRGDTTISFSIDDE